MKPFNIDKFKRSVTKSTGITSGYHDPKTWISTGNFAVNKLISSSYFRGIPLSKVSVLAGESGSGKSYLACGSLMKNAINDGVMCVLLDSEYAIDAEWLRNVGIDPENPLLIRIPVSTIDDCANIVNDFMKQYLADYSDDERPKVLFIMDSLGMLSTPTEIDQFQKGDMKGDMGRKAKQLKAFVTQCLKMFGPHEVGMVATNHVYASQNAYAPDDVISGGCLVPETLVSTPNGPVEIGSLSIGDMVDTMYGPQEVTHTWEFEKPTISIEMEDGEVITCTPEHKFLVANESGLLWIEAKDLSAEDEILAM